MPRAESRVAQRVAAIVPSVGRSRWLVPCLRSLLASDERPPQIVLVAQTGAVPAEARALADRVVELPGRVGFARAVNLGARETDAEVIATVNDDCVVDAAWLATLVSKLVESPGTAAVQGVNVCLGDAGVADGMGLAWNRYWQAVQLGRGRPPLAAGAGCLEVFGVSATAAVYRRSALERVAVSAGDLFDETLYAYYEDADLASRLRATGYRAYLVAAARSSHAGSASEAALPQSRQAFVYGNRYLVVARLLGRSFFAQLPLLWLRDLADAAGNGRAAGSIAAGWWRAGRLLARFAHTGPSAVEPAELRRLRAETVVWAA